MLWRCLEKKDTPTAYIRVIKDIYEGVRTIVKTLRGVTNDFPIDIGLHQGSVLSPFLFTIVVDELTKGIRDEILWCMLFVDDDIFLIDENRNKVRYKLERCKDTIEFKGFKLSGPKTEYLKR